MLTEIALLVNNRDQNQTKISIRFRGVREGSKLEGGTGGNGDEGATSRKTK